MFPSQRHSAPEGCGAPGGRGAPGGCGWPRLSRRSGGPAAPADASRAPHPPLPSAGALRTARRSPGGREAVQPGQRTLPLLPPPFLCRGPDMKAAGRRLTADGRDRDGDGYGTERSGPVIPRIPPTGPTPASPSAPGRRSPADPGSGIRAALWAEGYGAEPAARSAGALSPVAG